MFMPGAERLVMGVLAGLLCGVVNPASAADCPSFAADIAKSKLESFAGGSVTTYGPAGTQWKEGLPEGIARDAVGPADTTLWLLTDLDADTQAEMLVQTALLQGVRHPQQHRQLLVFCQQNGWTLCSEFGFGDSPYFNKFVDSKRAGSLAGTRIYTGQQPVSDPLQIGLLATPEGTQIAVTDVSADMSTSRNADIYQWYNDGAEPRLELLSSCRYGAQ